MTIIDNPTTARPAADNVRRFLDLSTAHLTGETRDRLCTRGIPDLPVYDGEYGWFVWVPEDPAPIPLHELPQDLLDILAYARSRACDYVLLDCDAPLAEGLPVYDTGD